jgi:predicted acetyltransferase
LSGKKSQFHRLARQTEGVTNILEAATIPEARKKGIGKSMTVNALLDAKKRGFRVGILQASSASYPIYQKLGFKEVFKYKLYLQS